jgi:hypothetical protein
MPSISIHLRYERRESIMRTELTMFKGLYNGDTEGLGGNAVDA